MAKKKAKTKESYGSIEVNRFSPPKADGWPKAINIVLGFEEALKLQLALQHRLLDINRLNRATRAGKAAGVNLCLYTEALHLTVNPGSVR